MVRVYAMYEPLKVFSYIGAALLLVGGLVVARFLYFYLTGTGAGHIQSLVLAGAVLAIGFQVLLIGLLADLIGANRRLLEEALYRLKRLESGETARAQGKAQVADEEDLVGSLGGRTPGAS
jgi:hypothetical protein